MRYRPIQAALRERVPFTLWGPSKARTALAAVAATAAALIPTVMIASPAMASLASNLTISDGANWEGGKVSFTLTYAGAAAGTYTLSTSAGTATSGTDYTATPSLTTITFPGTTAGGNNTATVTVQALTDATSPEADETFQLVATDDQGSPGTTHGTGTIWNSAPSNTFVLTGPSTVAETATTTGTGSSAVTTQATATVTATMSAAQTHPVVIPVSTADGSANSVNGANRDYTALPSNTAITIPTGQLSGTVTVSLWDDNVNEDPIQTFTVTTTGGTPLGTTAASGGDTIPINISDDDPTPTVKIGDAGAVTEGSTLGFPITLSGPSERGVGVTFATSDGDATDASNPATAGSDYTAVNRTVSVPNYATTATVLVPTLTDSAVEGPENVKATISGPTMATLGTPATASGTINDAQAAPTVTLSTTGETSGTVGHSTWFTEGDTGEVATKIKATLSGPSSIPVKVNYTFGGGTATNGVDYKGVTGTLTIPAGQTYGEFPVTIVGDTLYENPDETFNVSLTSPNNSINSSSIGPQTITINDTSDVQPTWTVGDVSVPEGNSGQTMAKVPITLSAPTNVDTVFNVALADGTATEAGTNSGVTAGADDYDVPSSRVVTIPAGSTTASLTVPINADTVYEHDETVTLTPSLTSGNVSSTVATGAQHSSTLTIANDDAKPKMTFNQTSGSEGTTLRVTGSIVGASQYPYTVSVAFAGGATDPATPGTDFEQPAVTPVVVNIARGFSGTVTPQIADIYLDPDNIDEPTETFTATATETTVTPVGFATSVGTYKINDDPGDLPPAASVSDESIGEDEGSVDVRVDLAFTGDTSSTTQTVTVPYWTVDGSAKAGEDYKETKGTLSFAPGEMSKTINVPIFKDKFQEGAEDFYVKLGQPGPAGAALTKGTGEVIIKANDGAPVTPPPTAEKPTIYVPAKITGAVPVSISGKATAGATVELWGAPVSSGKLVKLGTTEAHDNGMYSFSRWIGMGYKFNVKADDMVSETRTVLVEQDPVFVVSSPSKGMVKLVVQGNPRDNGQAVVVQHWVGGKWVTAWKGATGSNNQWTATVKEPSKSKWTLRAFVAGAPSDGILPGYSDSKTVTVK